jgi:DNA repair protein RecN (Recombination protein N)
MLHELRIKNLAIIDDAIAIFEGGLNVLTGETGAGKSIIIDALCLALGKRASHDVIRTGEKEAVIEAYFDVSPTALDNDFCQFLQDIGIAADDGIILKRIISVQGKSRAYINDSMVNIQTLSEISTHIIDVHGQYEHQSLLSPDNQLDLLDAYAGLFSERQEITELYHKQTALKQHISDLMVKEKEREQRLDIIRFQINEIETAALRIGEEEHLGEEAKVLSSASRLAELSNRAYEAIYLSDSACAANLSIIHDCLREIADIDARARDAVKSVEEALPIIEETSYFLRDYKENLEFNPDRFEEIQTRLESIKGLKRKYGNTIQEILDFKDIAVKDLDELQHSEEKLETLRAELESLKETITQKAQQLSKKRNAASRAIERKVISELSKLSMPDTKMSIHITHEPGNDTSDGLKLHSKGVDFLEFLISPNVGEELKPLSKIASGGELSRIMLALKGILAKGDRIPVLIFDEIDAGIGGRAAETVGQKLKNLSSSHQVICITHLPQIASYAGTHLKIAKKVRGKRTKVEIKKMEREERTFEIARMLSGDSSDVSIEHAREILKSRGK